MWDLHLLEVEIEIQWTAHLSGSNKDAWPGEYLYQAF